MSSTNNHVNVALCAPTQRIVVLAGHPVESSTGDLQIHHERYRVVAIVMKGLSNSPSYDYLVDHPEFGPTELAQIIGRTPLAIYTTVVCPGAETDEREMVDAAVKQLDEQLTRDFKQLRGIS